MTTHVLMIALALTGFLDEETTKELGKLQGTWQLVEGEMNGKPIADEHLKGSTMTVQGEVFTLKVPHQSDEVIRSRTLRISPSKKIKELEWVRETGPNKGKRVVAIYEFLDADNYKVCFHPAGETKPEKFDTDEGSGHIYHVWKRVKK